nr:helix-turn-helix domain-containing protein [uncultured Rhodopila sp.]
MSAPPLSLTVAAPQHLIRLIGEEETLALVEKFGGTRFYVARQGGDMANMFCEATAAALADAFGGEYLKVPTARRWRCGLYKARGLSYAQIARKLGATESSVWRWLHAAGETAQLSLPLPTAGGMTPPRARAEDAGLGTGQIR